MALKNYFVMWAAQRQDGSIAAPVESFEEERAAISQFHIRAGQAAGGTNLKDTVTLVTADGFLMDSAVFTHDPIQT